MVLNQIVKDPNQDPALMAAFNDAQTIGERVGAGNQFRSALDNANSIATRARLRAKLQSAKDAGVDLGGLTDEQAMAVLAGGDSSQAPVPAKPAFSPSDVAVAAPASPAAPSSPSTSMPLPGTSPSGPMAASATGFASAPVEQGDALSNLRALAVPGAVASEGKVYSSPTAVYNARVKDRQEKVKAAEQAFDAQNAAAIRDKEQARQALVDSIKSSMKDAGVPDERLDALTTQALQKIDNGGNVQDSLNALLEKKVDASGVQNAFSKYTGAKVSAENVSKSYHRSGPEEEWNSIALDQIAMPQQRLEDSSYNDAYASALQGELGSAAQAQAILGSATNPVQQELMAAQSQVGKNNLADTKDEIARRNNIAAILKSSANYEMSLKKNADDLKMEQQKLEAKIKAESDKNKRAIYIAELMATTTKWKATIDDLTSMQNANMRARTTIASNPMILADPSAAANAANIIGSGAMSNAEGQGVNDMARIFTPGNLQFGGSGTIAKMVSPPMLQKLIAALGGGQADQQTIGQSNMVPMPTVGNPVINNGQTVEHGNWIRSTDPYGKQYWYNKVTGERFYGKNRK